MRTRLLLVFSLLLSACSSAPKSPPAATVPPLPPPLTDEQRALNVASFEQVWDTVREQHWDPTLNGVDWDAARAVLRPRVEEAQTTDQARAVMQELLGRLGQSHFAIIPAAAYRESRARPKADAPASLSPTDSKVSDRADKPASSESAATTPLTSDSGESTAPANNEDETDSNANGSVGIQLRIAEGQALIIKIGPHSPADDAEIKPGWIITAINTRPLSSAIARLDEVYKDSTLREAMVSMSIAHRLEAPRGEKVRLTLRDGDDKSREITLISATPAGVPTTFAALPTVYVNFESRRLPDNVGYLAFNAFLDPSRVLPLINTAIKDSADADGLIIDLRGNIGGLGLMACGVGNWFVALPNQKLGAMKTRDTTLNFVLNPRAKPYTRPVAILVDGLSLSTAEIFAGGLQDLGRARLFGTRTGGAALPSQVVRLPNGDGFQFAFANYTSTGGRVLEGAGVTPDVVVPPSREALLRGEDPVIKAACDWIHAQHGS